MGERKIVFRNEEIRYRVRNEDGIETILMLHAAFADSSLFQDQVAYFEGDYRIVLIDLPGHGTNSGLSNRITLKDMPEICCSILSEHRIQSCHLLGISLGSLVAQAFADQYPNQVKSVTMVGGYSVHKANKAILRAQKKEGLKWMLLVLFSMKRFKRYLLSVSCHTERGKRLFEQGIQAFSRRSFSSMSGMNSFLVPKSAPMPYPLFIVVGEHDLLLARQAALELHRLESRSRMATIAGAGHCANADAPEEFNTLYRGFISAL
ncbi:alpha/beta fold hydrolase [Cohnella herbarum]|uniref:Alpha/beta fold hydrolase n=1 Tax=Cohnella herbarum TaxID=2728023 RepID=A0A7Z2VIV6_9BACL|nr:alpha/beta fold hydrolase [Cohnella herbarum]QJD83862.1 alpha/beta fold hydrolase [Cohnella herbarum]